MPPRRNAKRSSRKSVKKRSRKSRRTQRAARDDRAAPRRTRKSRASSKFAKYARATGDMTIIELQKMARDQGIPFGGLSKSKLLRKINAQINTY